MTEPEDAMQADDEFRRHVLAALQRIEDLMHDVVEMLQHVAGRPLRDP